MARGGDILPMAMRRISSLSYYGDTMHGTHVLSKFTMNER